MGLFYYCGLYNLNFHSLDILFSKSDEPPVFNVTMSNNRFKFLLQNLCFDDFTNRNKSWSHDSFAALRMLCEKCNVQFTKCLVPEDFLSIDESYPMRI